MGTLYSVSDSRRPGAPPVAWFRDRADAQQWGDATFGKDRHYVEQDDAAGEAVEAARTQSLRTMLDHAAHSQTHVWGRRARRDEPAIDEVPPVIVGDESPEAAE